MAYMKTLMLDASAARTYQQRYDGLRAVPVAAVAAPAVVPTSTTTITREAVGKALRTWRARVQHSPRDLNALNRAALNIEACLWYFQDDTLIVTSATSARTRYHVTATACDCPARGTCWHRWAWMVLDSARRPIASQQPVQRVTKNIDQLVEELF